MKIGILGTGHVAVVFARGFLKKGFEVKLGTRDPSKPKDEVAALLKETGKADLLVTTAEACKFGDFVMLATNWPGAEPTVKACGAALDGKILLDVTNPIKENPAYIAELEKLATSGGELVQSWAPKAKVVKVWNTVGNAMFVDPVTADGKKPSMFIGGDDAEAKKSVIGLLDQCGWTGFDIGGISTSRFLEPLCTFWCNYSLKTGNWNWAIGVHDGKK
jgi:8-hydroxy-5-deazaflavin:NADPH oxidoreductase